MEPHLLLLRVLRMHDFEYLFHFDQGWLFVFVFLMVFLDDLLELLLLNRLRIDPAFKATLANLEGQA